MTAVRAHGLGRSLSLLALLLFAFATAKSNAMQIAMALPGATAHTGMHAMPGMAADAVPRHHGETSTIDRRCAYCDAAAHPPIAAGPSSIAKPWLMIWPAVRTEPPSSPRYRSPVQPTARGPPPFLKA